MYADGAPIPARTVLLDALGTLLHFEDPAPRLRAGLQETLGVEVSRSAAAEAVREEIAHYRANLHRGADAEGLARVREECADVVVRSLGLRAVPRGMVTGILLDAFGLEASPARRPAL